MKTARRSIQLMTLSALTILAYGCGGGGGTSNSAPQASGVTIQDRNAGHALAGDILQGQYTYSDLEDDAQGDSQLRWLRDGVAIEGATNATYELQAADVPARITFEVIPVATLGTTTGSSTRSAALGTGTPPVLAGEATYLDSNASSRCDAGDKLILLFDQAMSVRPNAGDGLALSSDDHVLGSGALLEVGPAANEVTVILGEQPHLVVRNVPGRSRIEVREMMDVPAITSVSGLAAKASAPVAIVPGLAATGRDYGAHPTRSVALGDLDGDGDVDMVVANDDDQPNRVYLNDGRGKFTDSGQSLGSGSSADIELGDLDNDGDLDILTLNTRNVNRIYLNDGSGVFTSSIQRVGVADSRDAALGDLDGDGDLDAVLANGEDDDRLYINDGTGIFNLRALLPGNGVADLAVALGDMDSDGDLDLVSATAMGIYTSLNDGDGEFTPGAFLPMNRECQAIALGDMDRDGDLDVVLAIEGDGANPGAINLVQNDGIGGLQPAQLQPPQLSWLNRAVRVCLGDMDGDGDLDVLATSDTARSAWLANDGTGNLNAPSRLLRTNGSSCLATADLDADGDLDMAVGNHEVSANAPAAVQIFLGSLSGSTGSHRLTGRGAEIGQATQGATHGAAFGDIDGDGDPDLVTVSNRSADNKVYINDGSGAYSHSGQTFENYQCFDVTLGDLDMDGDLDIVLGTSDQHPTKIFTNDGSGVFTESQQALGRGARTTRIALGDLDRDGDLDMVCEEQDGENTPMSTIFIYTNDGEGVFSVTSRVMAAGSVIGDIALGDMDQDGDLDLVVGRFAKYTSINSDARDHIWFNDGHGRFLQSTVIGSDTASLRIALGDLDQDGDLDIVCTTGEGGQFRSVQGPSKCYINQGDGTFSESRIHSSNPNFNMRMDSLALGDINHDGHLDLVQKDRDGIIHLWHNRGDGSFLYGHYLVTRHFNNSIVGLYDVDADGDLDMYLSGCGQHVRNYVRWNR